MTSKCCEGNYDGDGGPSSGMEVRYLLLWGTDMLLHDSLILHQSTDKEERQRDGKYIQ